jgi:FixJ family two-component response regulator
MQSSEGTEVAVIEPDAVTRSWLARILRDSGYRPLLFESEMDFFCEHDLARAACLIADDSLPVLTSVQMLLLLNRLACRPPTIFLSASPSVEKAVTAIRAGALNFLPKPVGAGTLLESVRLAVMGSRRDRETQERRKTVAARFAELTPREHEVLEYVMAGRLNKQTAAILGTVEKTIKVHRARVMEKVGARNLPELVQLVETAGVFSGETAPASALAYWNWDMVHDQVTGNHALATLFHLRGAALDGAPLGAFIERVNGEDALRLKAAIDTAISSKLPYQARYRVYGDSGEERWVLAYGRVLCNSAGVAVRFPGVAVQIRRPAAPVIGRSHGKSRAFPEPLHN